MPSFTRMRASVVLNADSGAIAADAGWLAASVRDLFAAHDVEAAVELAHGPDVRRAVCEALAGDAEAVYVGGGDGTVRTAASVLVGTGRPLAVLPLGTLNHFAKDLGIPTSLPEAIAALVTGEVRAVDVGELNGQVFLNTSSIGMYADMVTLRDAERNRRGRSKWSALASASLRTWRDLKQLDVSIATEEGEVTRRTPFVFVGNNDYELRFPALGARRSIEQGILCLYVGDRLSRTDLCRVAMRAMTGRLNGFSRLDVFRTRKVLVHPHHHQGRVTVSLDGEVVRLAPPLVYHVREHALRVVAPRAK
jgi:diacylglycerol kinase family enzyme